MEAVHDVISIVTSPYAADVAAFLRLPSVQRFHSELVEGAEVDEASFWCRLFFARHRAEEEERKREKLHSRLSSLQTQRSTQQTDDLGWGDDDDATEEGTRGEGGQAKAEERTAGQTAATTAEVKEEAPVAAGADVAPSDAPRPSTDAAPLIGFPASSPHAGGRSASDADASVTAAALSALEAASPSPASSASEGSEGSGELVDRAELLDDLRRQGGGGGEAEAEEADERLSGEGGGDRDGDGERDGPRRGRPAQSARRRGGRLRRVGVRRPGGGGLCSSLFHRTAWRSLCTPLSHRSRRHPPPWECATALGLLQPCTPCQR